MLRIRFRRAGKRHQPTYRLVVSERALTPIARNKEEVGWYNPHTKESKVDVERVKYWISVGAQPSDTVHNFLVKKGVIEAEKIAVHSRARKNADNDETQNNAGKSDTDTENTTGEEIETEEEAKKEKKEETSLDQSPASEAEGEAPAEEEAPVETPAETPDSTDATISDETTVGADKPVKEDAGEEEKPQPEADPPQAEATEEKPAAN